MVKRRERGAMIRVRNWDDQGFFWIESKCCPEPRLVPETADFRQHPLRTDPGPL
jgi:hypothetical protein